MSYYLYPHQDVTVSMFALFLSWTEADYVYCYSDVFYSPKIPYYFNFPISVWNIASKMLFRIIIPIIRGCFQRLSTLINLLGSLTGQDVSVPNSPLHCSTNIWLITVNGGKNTFDIVSFFRSNGFFVMIDAGGVCNV